MDNRLDVNMQDGLAAAAAGTDRHNYLGDAQVVNQLVRNFFAGVFSERAKFHQGGNDEGATAAIEQLCRHYASIFMGESGGYVAQPWNSPHRLGIFLRVVTPDVNDYPTPAEAYFNFLALQALEAAIALEEGHMTDAEVQAGMTEVVEDAVEVLLGQKAGAQA